MDALLTYILHVNLLVSLIYLGYFFLLKKLTFYNLNRFYFLFGGIYAFVFPLIDFNVFFTPKIAILPVFTTSILPLNFKETTSLFNLQDLILYIIILGAFIFVLKIIMQFLSLARIHWNSTPEHWNKYYFRNVMFSIVPFTFFSTIYVHKNQHDSLELKDIFKHEFIHVKGLHTIDVLLFEIILFCCWYNPLIWFLRRAVSQNLEFLTDQKVLDLGIDRQTYQYSLLNVSKEGALMDISNQFNFKNLKKRIMMMNKRRSSKMELSAYGFLIPLLIITGISFTSFQAEAKIDKVVVNLNETELPFINNPMKGLKNSKIEFSTDTSKMKIVDKESNQGDFNGELDTVKIKSDDFAGKFTGITIKKSANSIPAKQKKKPLIILDGEKMPNNYRFSVLDPNKIQAMDILKDSMAVDQYGADGRDGVIRITTKAKTGKGSFVIKSPKEPMYLIDGEEITKTKLNAISPNDIEKITVLKGANATALYGKDGNNGAVLLTSKKHKKDSNNIEEAERILPIKKVEMTTKK